MSRPTSSVLINSTSATVDFYSSFRIQLVEEPFENCAWEVTLPPQIMLMNTRRSFQDTSDLREWEFMASSPGTHLIAFYYRKQCCSRAIIKTVVYSITVI